MANEQSEWGRKNLDHGITFAVEALKTMLLLNGGAAVAMLALLGPLSNKDSALWISIGQARWALYCFGGGALSVALTFMVAYIAQLFFMEHALRGNADRPAYVLRFVGIGTFAISAVLFAAGLVLAAGAVHSKL